MGERFYLAPSSHGWGHYSGRNTTHITHPISVDYADKTDQYDYHPFAHEGNKCIQVVMVGGCTLMMCECRTCALESIELCENEMNSCV